MAAPAAQVTERSFEDYHLYTLPLATTLHDRETKQVEFLRGSGIASKRLYIYDGVEVDRESVRQRTCARCRSTAPNPIRTFG